MTYRKIIWFILAILAIVLGGYFYLWAPSTKEEVKETGIAEVGKDTFPLEVANYNGSGELVTSIYEKPPERIIAIWQNSVETLLQLGAVNQIVAAAGIDDIRHLTKEDQQLYAKIPLKTSHTVSQETAVTLHPDFILGWRFDFTGKANSIGTWDFWNQRKVHVYMTNMDGADFLAKHTVEDELQYVRDVGRIVGKSEKTREITAQIENKLQQAEVKAATKGKKQKVVVVFYMDRELHIYTPRTLPGDIVVRLGGTMLGKEAENVGQDEVMSYEELRMEDPDVLFIQATPETAEEKIASVYSHTELRDLRCVKDKRIYAIPFYTIRDPAVRVGDAIDIFSEGLYPDI